MALLFMDGFDAGDYALGKWTGYSGTLSAVTSPTRFSDGRSLLIQNGGGSYITKTLSSPASRIFVGFTVYMTAATTINLSLNGDGNSNNHINVGVTTSSTIQVFRSGTLIATSAVLSGLFAWGYFEVSTTVDSTVGNVVVRFNGVEVINYTGNTKNGGTVNAIDGVSLGNNASSTWKYFDDIYVCDATGSAPYNTFLGDVRVYTMVPSAAGNSTGFTPSSGANYTTVDELPYSATDYVMGTSPTTKDTYQMSDLPTGATTVFGVQTNVIAKKTDAGTIALKPVVRASATDYTGTSVSLGGSDVTISDLRPLNPATGTSWTATTVNAMEAGMEIA